MLYWQPEFLARQKGEAAPVRPELQPLEYAPERTEAKPAVRPIMRQRMYEGAKVNRHTADWQALSTSGDSEILTSLRLLRARSRWMVRENPYALQGVRELVNNVIGSGIGFQAQVKDSSGSALLTPINNRIEEEWHDWSAKTTAHTGGILHFADIERLAFWQLVESGEAIIRKVRQPFGGGKIPFALELMESDRLMDQWQTARAPNGNVIKMGVEQDGWGRPVAYWFWPNHPGDYQFQHFQPSKFLRIEADEIIHLYTVERWPQTRGIPWLHAGLMRLRHADRYEDAELIAARASANIVGFITSPDVAIPPGEEEVDPSINQRILDTEPGQFETLLPGESFQGFNPSRPNTGMEPFMRYLVRSVAVGLGGPGYSSLSGDYSQHNYNSLRMEKITERDAYRIMQAWFIRNFRASIHPEWCEAAYLAGAIPATDYYSHPKKYQAARFKPRGWTWIDPKEIKYMTEAVRSGFTTVSDVIEASNGGQDAEDTFTARRKELDLMQTLGLVFDTDPAAVDAQGEEQPDATEPDGDPDDKATQLTETA